jgi:hypothetical protein
VLALETRAEGVWDLELEGPDNDDPPGSRRFPVKGRFVNAPARVLGGLAGELIWTISRIKVGGAVARTTRFQLQLKGEAYTLRLSFHGPSVRLQPGFTADGYVSFCDGSRDFDIRFRKGLDEEPWLRLSGPHRIKL